MAAASGACVGETIGAPARYLQGVDGGPRRRAGQVALARAVLVAFVAAWLLGPELLRTAVPVWVAFAVAAGLEVHFVVSALRGGSPARPNREPQRADLDRYGYGDEPGELLLVRDGGRELWVAYEGETGEELEALVERARADAAGQGAGGEPTGPPDEDHEADTARDDGAQREPTTRAISRFATGLAVIGALAALVWAVEANTGWRSLSDEERAATEARLSEEASAIAGKPVVIRCDESGNHVGVVQHADGVAVVGGTLAYLTPQRCYDLARLAFHGDITASRTARAIAVLAHEAWHLRGVRDEGTTECLALQSGVGLGVRLGLSPATAAQMMRQQLAENLDRSSSLEYRVPPECRDGSALDLDPADGRFP